MPLAPKRTLRALAGRLSPYQNPAIWSLVSLAFLLRIPGIFYGLPLWLVADEPPFILGALTMLQLKTLLPVLHLSAFSSVLYYEPYLSYLYVIPFGIITGVQFLFWHDGTSLFAAHLLSDLSAFFITARFINIVLGAASVYVLYRIAESLFK